MTAVKLCGMTRLEDAELAAELGAWAELDLPAPAAGPILALAADGAQ